MTRSLQHFGQVDDLRNYPIIESVLLLNGIHTILCSTDINAKLRFKILALAYQVYSKYP